MKIIAIIQARMLSSRLPEKVMLDLGGKPMLQWVIERTGQASLVDVVVVATTLDPTDDRVFAFCRQMYFRVHRGSVYDVLDRYYRTAKEINAEIVVRITADCPLIDPDLIDEAIKLILPEPESLPMQAKLKSPRFDFVANRLPPPWGRTYPIGLDIEVFTFDILKQAWKLAKSKHQREHVTPYFYEGIPANQLNYVVKDSPFSSAMTSDGHHIALMHYTPDYGHLRWTVDTPDDLKLIRAIVSNFRDNSFKWKEVLSLVNHKPELSQINAHIQHKTQLDVDSRA